MVALAASVDGCAIAAGRGNGSIEIWIVAPGSVGWHCELTIPGRKDASLSCLLWCPSVCSRRGRLFSAGLDGHIVEWDLQALRAKEVLKSYGGSVWQMVLEPTSALLKCIGERARSTSDQSSSLSTDSDSSSDDDEDSRSEDEDGFLGVQKVAVACDDGCVRLFTLLEGENLVYQRSFPRVLGRILSVAWSVDATKVFSGGSDGCIRCWDSKQLQELYRITAGLGGTGNGSKLCIWSIVTLRDGTVVSGDSSGSTQFWDGKQGTLLNAHTGHKADVLALASSPNHQSVFSAGADGQIVQYQLVPESRVLADAARKGAVDVGMGLGERWVFVSSKRTHTHDVNALVVAFPQVSDDVVEVGSKSKSSRRKRKKLKKSWMEQHQLISDQSGVIPMLVSGGNDAKLFTYPANAFLAFHPHDVCPAPQRTPVSLALSSKLQKGLIMMAQHEHQVEVWKINVSGSVSGQPGSVRGASKSTQSAPLSPLGKRKSEGGLQQDGKQRMANGHGRRVKTKATDLSNGQISKPFHPNAMNNTVKAKGSPPELLARIKCKSVENITCSAISDTGQLVAFSDQTKPRLFELEQQLRAGTGDIETWGIKKRRLPKDLAPPHCMAFCGPGRLLLASPDNAVLVVDTETPAVLHRFVVEGDSARQQEYGVPPLTSLCTSSDNRWLATSNSRGNIFIFNLETFREHWRVPPLDGSYVTAATFHPINSGFLIVTTNANVLYMLDVEARKLGDWSHKNGHRLPTSFLEFPGGIQGLTVSPSAKRTIAIVYSAKAMCLIDFQKPVPCDASGLVHKPEKGHLSNGMLLSNKTMVSQSGGSDGSEKNFVLVPFKDPVLFVGHVAESSILVVEKPWLDALNQLPPPVYRHLYGT